MIHVRRHGFERKPGRAHATATRYTRAVLVCVCVPFSSTFKSKHSFTRTDIVAILKCSTICTGVSLPGPASCSFNALPSMAATMTEASLAKKLKAYKPECTPGTFERFEAPAFLKPDATAEEKAAAAERKKIYNDNIKKAFVALANGVDSDAYLALQPIFALKAYIAFSFCCPFQMRK